VGVEEKAFSTGWPPEISITCVRWQNGGGIGRAGLLASGSASGLCRVDFLKGHVDRTVLATIRNRQAGRDKREALAAASGKRRPKKGKDSDSEFEDL
jgi:hypothetical protein